MPNISPNANVIQRDHILLARVRGCDNPIFHYIHWKNTPYGLHVGFVSEKPFRPINFLNESDMKILNCLSSVIITKHPSVKRSWSQCAFTGHARQVTHFWSRPAWYYAKNSTLRSTYYMLLIIKPMIIG